ncbi:MAG: xanthine dehydrogenase family protein subunit M [Burkholderiaceae bacterium]|nr:xanthine dehydrogenase family protein subunit M [Burkholderiaceae bacterium]
MYPFNYLRPTSVEAAHQSASGDARYLAGGQSLVQSMRLRLASAESLVDLGGIESLRGIKVDATSVTIGAMTTHAAVARDPGVLKAIPALASLAGGIGDQMVRNAGTIGGAIANADPAACYPAAVVGLGATIVTDQREIAGDDFFIGLYETALEPGELIVAVRFPIPKRAAYVKFKQPASRFALVGVMVSEGSAGVRVGVTGARASAYREQGLEAKLAGNFSAKALDGAKLASDGMNTDLHATAEYRAAMVVVMAQRALAAAG